MTKRKATRELKNTDLALFHTLRNDGRMSLSDISRATRIPVSTVYERLRQFSGGIIQKYTVLLDFRKLGYMTRMHLLLRVKGENKADVMNFLLNQLQVNNAYHINNGFDISCDVLFHDMYEADAFLKRLEDEFHVSKVQPFYILEEIKREGFFMNTVAAATAG
ncbi:Lrp/AsnC family transcriptional regulator [Candidatus Woesearchaeota archaeon]|nr:Lrp/AsnC family transcriptional regulator [Candidatus Woesearchaeota archaeon]